MKIFKYKIEKISEVQAIDMPIGAKILHVGVQDHELFVWALVYPDNQSSKRYFFVAATGEWLSEKMASNFIGTVQVPSAFGFGQLVWHIFEVEVA